VTNIINEFTKDLEVSDLERMRELAALLKREGMRMAEFASICRRHNYIKKLRADPNQIESLIANIASSSEPEKLIDIANQIAQLSGSESIPLDRMADHI